MKRTIPAAALLVLALPALAQQEGGMPEMTPEQKAEMEAYMKAETPGEPHRHLAESVGTYDVKIELSGFKTTEQRGIVLSPNDTRAIDVTLEIGRSRRRSW